MQLDPKLVPISVFAEKGSLSAARKTRLLRDGASDRQREAAKVQHQLTDLGKELLRQPGMYIKMQTQHLPWVSVKAPQLKVARTQKPHSAQAILDKCYTIFPLAL